eukprot:31222-Pelagococcus_subviridis.AAC.1
MAAGRASVAGPGAATNAGARPPPPFAMNAGASFFCSRSSVAICDAIFPFPVFGSNPGTKNDVAIPSRPARPVRPILWTYESKSSAAVGRSKLTTCATPGTSIPRAATSVATITGAFPDLKLASAASRCDCVRSPCMDSALTPCCFDSWPATHAAVRFFWTKTSVSAGGGAFASAAISRSSLWRLSHVASSKCCAMAFTVLPTRPTPIHV